MKPRYLETLQAGGMSRKVEEALALLGNPCRVCPHYCPVDRANDEKAICRTGRWANLNSYGNHFGAEDRIRGWNGSGALSFSQCALQCVFCQRARSGHLREGKTVDATELAGIMLELQERGTHNISLVNPSHVVPQIVEALALAAGRGLHVPMIYVTCAFDSAESLAVLDGLVDVYVAEFRIFDRDAAARLTLETSYAETSRRALREMHRQVGDLALGEDGLAARGLMVRHMVLPHDLAGTRGLMRFLAKEVSRETYVNMIADYEPADRAAEFPEIDRPTSFEEYQRAVDVARQEGLTRLDTRESYF